MVKSKPKRYPRPRKSDRLFCPDATKAEIACDMAHAPFDRAVRHMDKKWGIDRLPELVSPATAEKYGVTMANLNAALEAQVQADVVACVESCIRGLHVMDAEATAAGHEPAQGRFFEFELEARPNEEPFKFAVLEDGAEWQTAKEKRPDLLFFTQREVAIALRDMMQRPLVEETKKHFPGAEVIKTTPQPKCDFENGGDPIPF